MLPAIAALPNFNGKFNIFGCIVCINYLQFYRHWNLSIVFNRNQIISLRWFYFRNPQIYISIAIKPAFPKPGYIFARNIFYMVKKIIWLWMFIGPSMNVAFKRIVKTLRPQNVFAKQIKSSCWFIICSIGKIKWMGNIWIGIYTFPLVKG